MGYNIQPPQERRKTKQNRENRNTEAELLGEIQTKVLGVFLLATSTAFPFDFYFFKAVLRIRIRIHRIHMFLGLPDPDLDPLVRGMDPDPHPSLIMQK